MKKVAIVCGVIFGVVSFSSVSVVRAESKEELNSDESKSSDANERGAELWSMNCGRCHNKISPDNFSDQQWDVVTQHMRMRANLTGEEVREIVNFLKSAN